jgi:hypothetical protein
MVSALRGDDDRLASAARFLIAWAVPTWVLFELLPTKLPHYVLPLYPALALAAGWGLVELGKAAHWQRWAGWALFAIGAGVFAIFLPYVFITYGNNASWDAIRLAQAGFEGGFQLGLDPYAAAWVFGSGALFLALSAATLTTDRLRPGVLALVFAVLSGLGWQVAARSGAFAEAYAVRLADQVRAARAYSETITGLSPDEIVTASSYTEPSLAFSLGTDTVLGESWEVVDFALNRSEPTMLVLDLSRSSSLRALLIFGAVTGVHDDVVFLSPPGEDDTQLEYTDFVLPSDVNPLGICHRALASGTNYSRGDDTTLLILFTRCAPEDTANDPQD